MAAGDIIMAARAHWFEDEDTAGATKPEMLKALAINHVSDS